MSKTQIRVLGVFVALSLASLIVWLFSRLFEPTQPAAENAQHPIPTFPVAQAPSSAPPAPDTTDVLFELMDKCLERLARHLETENGIRTHVFEINHELNVLSRYVAAGEEICHPVLGRNAVVLRNENWQLWQAVRKKDLAEAKRSLATLSQFRTPDLRGKFSVAKSTAPQPLPLREVMQRIEEQAKSLSFIDWVMEDRWNENEYRSHMLAAMTWAITAHVPAHVNEEHSGASAKWLAMAAEVRTTAMTMATAAYENRASDFRTAWTQLEASCTKCHELYRKWTPRLTAQNDVDQKPKLYGVADDPPESSVKDAQPPGFHYRRPRQLVEAIQGQHGLPLSNLAISADSKRLVLTSITTIDGRTVSLYHLPLRVFEKTKIAHKSVIDSVAFSCNSKFLASGGSDRTVKLWRVDDGGQIWSVPCPHFIVTCMAFTSDDRLLAVGAEEGTLDLLDVESGKTMQILLGHQGSILSLVFRSDGKVLLSLGQDRQVRIYDVATGRLLDRVPLPLLPGEPINQQLLSPDARRVAWADGTAVGVWDLNANAKETAFGKHDAPVVCMGFSADGRMLVTADRDNGLRAWETASGRLLTKFVASAATQPQKDPRIRSLAVFPDGKHVAIGYSDGGVNIWRIDELPTP